MRRTEQRNIKSLKHLKTSDIKMLFLAKYAPAEYDQTPPLHPEDGVFPRYHHEIFTRLSELGFKLTSSARFETLLERGSEFDYVFCLYNRAAFRNSEIFVAAVCEYLHVPYLGAPPHIRALAEDKHLAKLLAVKLRIPTSPWTTYRTCDKQWRPPRFRGPYFIKPRFGAASEGLSERSLQDSWDGTSREIGNIIATNKDVLVERFIQGINVTVPIVGGLPPFILPPMRTLVNLSCNFETYRQKRLLDPGITREIYQDQEKVKIVERYAMQIFNEARPLDYSRVDFRVPVDPSNGPPMFLELNVCCNLGSHSAIARPAEHVGISQLELIAHILNFSFRRQGICW